MTLVLNKTVGKFSAGTVVRLSGDVPITPDCEVVEADYTHVEFYTDWQFKRQQKRTPRTEVFECPVALLTERRNREKNDGLVPAIPREKTPNRIARRQLYKMLQSHEAVV